jgi:hypothetical protein
MPANDPAHAAHGRDVTITMLTDASTLAPQVERLHHWSRLAVGRR